MPVRITIEFDSPEEVAQLFAQLPGLACALPSGAAGRGNLDERAHARVNRAARFEVYRENGGHRSFLGWAQSGEPPNKRVKPTRFLPTR